MAIGKVELMHEWLSKHLRIAWEQQELNKINKHKKASRKA